MRDDLRNEIFVQDLFDDDYEDERCELYADEEKLILVLMIIFLDSYEIRKYLIKTTTIL